MALNFVAMEIGLPRHASTLFIARALGDRRAALGLILELREIVLNHGDRRGLIPFTPDELAAMLEWKGSGKKLLTILTGARVVKAKRRILFYADWAKSTTGYYQQRRETDRERKEVERRELQAARHARDMEEVEKLSVDSPRTGRGLSTDRPRDNSSKKERKGANGAEKHPPTPPSGGGKEAAARLEWFEDKYPKGLVNREKALVLLGEFSEADWEHLKFAVSTYYLKKPPRFIPGPDVLLKTRQFREIKLPKSSQNGVQKKKAAKRAPSPEELARQSEIAAREEAIRVAFTKREEIKARLRAEGLRGQELEERIDNELARQGVN